MEEANEILCLAIALIEDSQVLLLDEPKWISISEFQIM